MNDELKEWIRILKFGLPATISYAFILSGCGLVILVSNDMITQLKGMVFAVLGLLIFETTDNFRLRNKNRELKKVSECQKN